MDPSTLRSYGDASDTDIRINIVDLLYMLVVWYGVLGVLGSVVGSFLNAWVWRVRAGESIVRGRSMCPHCRHALRAPDLIPLISFVLRRGKCAYCRKNISLQYPLVELALALVFVGFACVHRIAPFDVSIIYLRDVLIAVFLTLTFVYDFLYMEILDQWTMYPALVLCFASLMFGWQSWLSLVIGIGIGGGFFLLQYVVSQGRWIGAGDIRLGVFMGVILGWPLILFALFIAYIAGAGVSLILLALKKKRLASETPFGTYLAGATFIAMIWGKSVMDWYLGLIGF